MMQFRRIGVAALVVCCSIAVFAQTQPAPNWAAWQFLHGRWEGEGSSEVGQGSGYFTFEPALQNKAWIRRNHSEYPATKDRPKYVHEDFMIVYFDPSINHTRAFYYDTEGHAIHYTASFSSDDKTLTFLSDKQEGAPRFRLSYTRTDSDHMSLTLEMAPPGENDFKLIVQGKVRKVPSV